jgi:hypothetical protein
MKRANYKKINEHQNNIARFTSNNKKHKEMKTNNNFQKTILKSTTVLMGFVIISLNVNAQNLWKAGYENFDINQIEYAMIDNIIDDSNVESNGNRFDSFLVQENEEALELENWMTDMEYFEFSTFKFVEEIDTELEIQDWMLNEKIFAVNSVCEQPLELESWMLSEKIW